MTKEGESTKADEDLGFERTSPAADDGPPPPAHVAGKAGTYTIVRELDRGGQGALVVARDSYGREVALKQLLPNADPERFQREVAISARLEHPGIVTFYDAGTLPSGDAFYVMRLVRGQTLGDAIARARTLIARFELLERFIGAIEAVGFAHARGIIHRDLKPANILLGDHGETIVIDWGLARDLADTTQENRAHASAAAEQPGLTEAGRFLGTPLYAAPEQGAGEPCTRATDVFALGLVAYEILTGASPRELSGSFAEVLAQIVDGELPPLASRQRYVPEPVRRIIETATSREPGARYANAKALADELKIQTMTHFGIVKQRELAKRTDLRVAERVAAGVEEDPWLRAQRRKRIARIALPIVALVVAIAVGVIVGGEIAEWTILGLVPIVVIGVQLLRPVSSK